MNAARWLLSPLSLLYAGVIRGRNLYYDRVSAAVRGAGIPVISVGNLTVGGTGKTPLVIEIVRRLRALGRRPAILTRGYKAGANQIADEVQEFHGALPGVPVVVNPDRVMGAATARDEHEADCLVLDDGFQHRRLARDLDLVLIDALRPWGGRWVLPAGRLREPLSGLQRADAIVITRANQVAAEEVDAIAVELRRWAGRPPIWRAAVVAESLVRQDGRRESPADLSGRRVLAVCGIGNPRTFEKLVSSLTGMPGRSFVFPDHHRYGAADAQAIRATASQVGADQVVTTRKDWVKLALLWPVDGVELAHLDVRLELQDADQDFDERLRRALEKHR